MKKLFNFRLALFIALSLCCGISTAYFFMRNYIVWGVLFLSVFIVCVTLFLTLFLSVKKLKRNVAFSLVFVLFFTFGALSFWANINTFETADLGGRQYAVLGRVISAEQTDYGSKITIEKVNIKGNVSGNLRYKAVVSVYGKNQIGVGDNVSFTTRLFDRSYLYEDRFNASDVERGIKYYANVSASEVSVLGNSLTVFEKINLFIKNTLKNGLEQDEFSVAYAMLTGDDGYIDYDLLTSYRAAGVAHVFAVSGLHIGFLATALSFLFKKLRIKGLIKATLITFILLLYSGVCGFSASSLRATVMTALMLFATAKGSRYDGLTAISCAAILILCVSPTQLFCVGFQLSFTVVLGINLLSRPVAKLFKFLPEKFASVLGTVISAQVVAIPISLHTFGAVSWVSVMINLLFLPVASVIFTATLLLTLIGGLFSIPTVALFIPNYVLKIINLCIYVFDSDIFMIGGATLGSGIIAYYLIAIVFSGLVNLKLKIRKLVCVALSAVCLVTACAYTVADYSCVKLCVSGSQNVSATLIKSPSESTLVVSDVNYIYSVGRLKRISACQNVKRIDNLVFMGGYAVDMQVFITKLRTVFTVENVYYYGEKDEVMEGVVIKSFNIAKMKNFIDGQELPLKDFECKFALEGNVLSGKIGSEKTAIFSSFSKQFSFVNFNGDYDIMICYEGAQSINQRYKPNLCVSYRYDGALLDAESNGNLLIKAK